MGDVLPFEDSKPAIASETVRGGIYEIGNGLAQIVGNVFGISQAVAIINGLVSIAAGVQTIRSRKKATKRIEGVFRSPAIHDEDGV